MELLSTHTNSYTLYSGQNIFSSFFSIGNSIAKINYYALCFLEATLYNI